MTQDRFVLPKILFSSAAEKQEIVFCGASLDEVFTKKYSRCGILENVYVIGRPRDT